MNIFRVSRPVFLIGCSFLLAQAALCAQEEQSTAQSPNIRLEVRAADQIAVSSTSEYRVHVHPVNTEGKSRFSPLPAVAGQKTTKTLSESRANGSESAALVVSSVPTVPAPGFYPADLSYQGGALVTSAQSHPVYVDCAEKCWASPEKFLGHLFQSDFIHVADQYVGSTANRRYTVGKAAAVSYPIIATLSDNDILQIVHTAASALGSGYDHIYHVFLPKGVDECFVGTTACYSPDNLSTFAFCAYHGSVTYTDIGHVLFTVEPFQDVSGCSMLQPSPNGPVVDSTSSTLGHETFETITDPDPGTGWIAINSIGVIGEEIGDLCSAPNLSGPGFDDPVVTLNGKNYQVQPMYSNKFHACSFAP